MAYTDMGDFLRDYCKHLHITKMPSAVVNRLLDDHKKGLLNKTQEQWIKDYFEEKDGKLVRKELPVIDFDYITPDELKKVYDGFAIAMAGMKSAAPFYDKVKGENARTFLRDYFDTYQVFQIPNATDQAEKSIKNIVDFFNTCDPNISNELKNKIWNNVKKPPEYKDKLFGTVNDINKLLTKCKNKEYNKNKSVQDKIQQLSRYLSDYLGTFSYGADPAKDALLNIKNDLEIVSHEDAFSNITYPERMSLEDFGKNHLPVLLERLYSDKDVREKFEAKDDKGIVEKGIGKAEKMGWDDPKSEDYVKPKYDDELTPLQQLEKWADDTYKDTLKKYEELRGGHLFSSPHAKEICKAIDKIKIKPADGLKTLLDKSAEVKGKIGNANSASHFDWFVETMNEVKDEIPKAIEGCWQDANQMKCVIEKIILKATERDDEDLIKKAETAMEIMTVMKYGMMTSKVMDAMRKSDFKVFSDGELSWNKNDGIQFVTKAFDQSVKAAFLGIGYTATIIKNQIKLRNINFSKDNNKSGLLADRINEINKRSAKDPTNKTAYEAAQKRDEKELEEQQATLDSLSGSYDEDKTLKETTEAELNKINEEITKEEEEIKKLEEEKAKLKQDMEELSIYKQNYDDAKNVLDNRDLDSEKESLEKQQKTNKLKIGEIDAKLKSPVLTDPYGNPIEDEESIKATREKLAQDKAGLYSEANNIIDALNQNSKDRNPATMSDERKEKREHADKNKKEFEEKHQKKYNDTKARLEEIEKNLDARKANLTKLRDDYSTKSKAETYTKAVERVNQFDDATKRVKELTKAHEERETALSTWDQDHINKVLYLESYWNMLNGGESKTWRLFTSNAQDNFDAAKDERIKRILLNAQHLKAA
ncbi:MAG: hypothetical protein IKZ49_02210 [Alphaproteobacteria bacterium]|nr:hypothetical protein [Alphaproteobacteria bacterium]